MLQQEIMFRMIREKNKVERETSAGNEKSLSTLFFLISNPGYETAFLT
jgi:hypothetical protein